MCRRIPLVLGAGVFALAPSAFAALSLPPAVVQAGRAHDPAIHAGYLDVTIYGADPMGVKDSTVAIQKAMNDARDYSFATYLPAGTYLISDTLEGQELMVSGSSPGVNYSPYTNIGTPYPELQAPSLVGPASGPRPVLQLSNGAAGFGNPGTPKPLVHFIAYSTNCPAYEGCPSWRGEGDSLYAAVLRDVDLKLGTGNAGAIGFQFSAAQSSYVENVSIDATGAYAGVQGGTTEVLVNLAVTGGQYGIIATSRAGIALVGITLKNQSTAGLLYDTSGLVLVGFDIEEGSAAAIVNGGFTDQGITLELLDGTISIATGSQPAILDPYGDNLHISNVFVKTPGVLVQSGGQPAVAASGGQDWIEEYAYTNAVPLTRNGITSTSYTLIDGARGQASVINVQRGGATPPADLVLRHLPGPLPWYADAGALDVTAMGAVGDGVIDDTMAIQNAIDQADEVFLPRGDYVISKTLTLKPNTQLYGVPGMRARIYAPNWNPAGQFQPFIQSADTATGHTYLADMWLHLPDDINGVDQTYLSGLDWRAGRSSIVRQVYVMADWEGSNFTSAARKLVHVDNHGGGRWYGLQLSQTKARMANPDFRVLFVDGTSEPITFYGANPEHEVNEPFLEFNAATNARMLGFKEEGAATLIANSRNVMIAAHTGDTYPKVQVVDSQDVSVATFGAYDGFGDPTSVIVSDTSGGTAASIPQNDRCSLFKRGTFDGSAFPFCGDGMCDGAETGANCAADCSPNGSGGTGEGGSGLGDAGSGMNGAAGGATGDGGTTSPGSNAEPGGQASGGCACTAGRNQRAGAGRLELLIALGLLGTLARRKPARRGGIRSWYPPKMQRGSNARFESPGCRWHLLLPLGVLLSGCGNTGAPTGGSPGDAGTFGNDGPPSVDTGSPADSTPEGSLGSEGGPLDGGSVALANPAPGSKFFVGANFWNIDWEGQVDFFVAGTDFATTINPWQPQLIADLAPYHVLRFMDWNLTNNSNNPQAVWATRKQKTAMQNEPVAFEWQIDLCNRTKTDYWLNVPHEADPSYWQSLAQLVHDQLDPSLRVYLEWSNEVWNGGFPQHAYAAAQAQSLSLPGSDPAAAYYVYASVRVFEAFEAVFGKGSSRVVNVLAGQAAYTGPCMAHMTALADSRINPNGTKPDVYAAAPYFSGTTTAALSSAIATTVNWTKADVMCASGGGLPLVSYEGGSDSFAAGSGCVTLQHDPMMHSLYGSYLDGQSGAGLKGPFMQYTHAGSCWGLKEKTSDSLSVSPKYQGVLDWLAAHP